MSKQLWYALDDEDEDELCMKYPKGKNYITRWTSSTRSRAAHLIIEDVGRKSQCYMLLSPILKFSLS